MAVLIVLVNFLATSQAVDIHALTHNFTFSGTIPEPASEGRSVWPKLHISPVNATSLCTLEPLSTNFLGLFCA